MIDRRPVVSVSGEVEQPASLTSDALESLVDVELLADFHSREGWSRLGEIELTREPAEARAATIALARLGA